jgi:hypothetical protein
MIPHINPNTTNKLIWKGIMDMRVVLKFELTLWTRHNKATEDIE